MPLNFNIGNLFPVYLDLRVVIFGYKLNDFNLTISNSTSCIVNPLVQIRAYLRFISLYPSSKNQIAIRCGFNSKLCGIIFTPCGYHCFLNSVKLG